MDQNLFAKQKTQALRAGNDALDHAFDRYDHGARKDLFRFNLDYRIHAAGGRRAELLQNPAYQAVLDQYRT